MTRQSLSIITALLVFVGSAAESSLVRAQEKTVPGWTLDQPREAIIPIGGTGYLTVTINREGYKGPIKVEIQDLPKEIHLKESTKTIAANEGKVDFPLIAAADLKEVKLTGAKVVATSEGSSQSKDFVISVQDFNLESTSGMVMAISVIAVIGLTAFCVWRVFSLPPVDVEEHLKGPLDIDTRDTQDAD